MRRRDFLAGSLASLAPIGFVRGARASYPDRPVRLIIPRGAGGVLDVVGRHWCNRIAASLGSSVYIENIAGAGGMIGMASAAKAPPDGYTFLLGSTSDVVLRLSSSASSLSMPTVISSRFRCLRFRSAQSAYMGACPSIRCRS